MIVNPPPIILFAIYGREIHTLCCEILIFPDHTLRPISGGNVIDCDEVIGYGSE